MSIKKAVVALALALPLGALAENQQQLVRSYTDLAGSEENASSLVSGLRDGKPATLTMDGTPHTFTPPTGPMGWGNVDHALALAALSLEKQGITDPTPAQLDGALTEVLNQRAAGQGWGQIAQGMGVKLGDVKRPDKVTPPAPAEGVARVERPAAAGLTRPEKPVRPDKPERPGKNR